MSPNHPKDKWDILNIFVPFLSTLILIGFGAMASDSIQDAFKERQLEVSSGQAMQELLIPLMSGKTEPDQFRASAYALAAFGPSATFPLIKVLDSKRDYEDREVAADALLYSSLLNPKQACNALTMVIGKHSKLFHWETHKSAIQLIGNLKCTEAKNEIENYWGVVQTATVDDEGGTTPDPLQGLKDIVRFDGADDIDQESIKELESNLCSAIANLNGFRDERVEWKEKCKLASDSEENDQ